MWWICATSAMAAATAPLRNSADPSRQPAEASRFSNTQAHSTCPRAMGRKASTVCRVVPRSSQLCATTSTTPRPISRPPSTLNSSV